MKQIYETPMVQVLEMELQGVIATSGEFGNPPDIDNNNI